MNIFSVDTTKSARARRRSSKKIKFSIPINWKLFFGIATCVLIGLVIWIGIKSESSQDQKMVKEKKIDPVMEALQKEVKSLKDQVSLACIHCSKHGIFVFMNYVRS